MNIIEKAIAKLESELDSDLEAVRLNEAKPDHAVPVTREDASHAMPSSSQPEDDGPAPAPAPAPVSVPTPVEPGVKTERSSEVVELDLARLGSAGLLTPQRSESLLAEQMRIIKRPLLERATPESASYVESGNLIIVTSSLPGEGKTYCAINLAISISMEMDRTVLLVDADPAKSDISRVLGLSPRKGLTNFLSGEEMDLSKLLVRTKSPAMSILPSGPRHPHMTELMSSKEMRRLVDELSSRYSNRIIVFDSAPVLATSGVSVLASLMGQVVMVVEAVRTPQSSIHEALRQLGTARNVGVLYNKERTSAGRGYGYGYGVDTADKT